MVDFVSDETMVAVMDGAHPPEDFDQAEAYFAIAHRRLSAIYGPDWERDAHLLAGAAPELMVEHWRRSEERRMAVSA